MKRRGFLLVLLSTTALAGGIYDARCADCGYTQDELRHGYVGDDLRYGSSEQDPFAFYAIYWVADWRQVVGQIRRQHAQGVFEQTDVKSGERESIS